MESAKNFKEKLARIYQAIGSDKASALARVLGVKPPSIAAAQKRQQIPGGWIESVAEKCGVSADWLFFGTGSMRQGERALRERELSPGLGGAACPHCADLLERLVQAQETALRAQDKTIQAQERASERESALLKEYAELKAEKAGLEARLSGTAPR